MADERDDDLIAVLHRVAPERVNEILALLGSAGIEAAYRASDEAILVAAAAQAEARELLSDFDPTQPEAPVAPERPTVFWSRRGSSALAAVTLWCLVLFWSVHLSTIPASRQRLLDHGAISWSLVESGEVWRWFAAIFLHFDGAHLLSNLLTLALVGPPLAHHLGAGRFLLVFILTGVAGNLFSHVLVPSVGLKAGASGAIAGVLGALAGQTLRPEFRGRFRRWQILGALGAIYALLVGIGPGRDNAAHAGGLLAGVLLGRLLLPIAEEGGRGHPAADTEVGPDDR